MAWKWRPLDGYTMPDVPQPIIQEVLTWITHHHELSLNQLHKRIGLKSSGGLPEWYALGKDPRYETLVALSRYTGIPLEELLAAVAEGIRLFHEAPREGQLRVDRANRARYYTRGPRPGCAIEPARTLGRRRLRRRIAALALLIGAGLAAPSPGGEAPRIEGQGALCNKRRPWNLAA